jgi:radical SAM protein with 4Fe4S-binding SPASM domain
MQQDDRDQLNVARLLFENHWLSHARQKCHAALAAGTEASSLLRDIEHRLRDRSSLDLSRDDAPIAILLEKQCIVSTLHFRHPESDRLKREAFRQAVSYIDIETSSKCNRKCLYCPNSQNDRLSSNQFMDDNIFASFMNDLHTIDYARDIHFVGYNEPLLYIEDILGRIALARRLVSSAKIVVFTNGDYLERENLGQLIEAGANEIIISVHLPPGQPYSDESTFSRINKMAERLGTPIVPQTYLKDMEISARLVHEGISILIRQIDYQRFGSNRASTLDNVGPSIDVRTAACLMPIYQFIVGHQGAVVPCCVMVSDDPRNAEYLVGNIGQTPIIFDTYCGKDFVAWRRSLFNLAPKQDPCRKCAWDAPSPLLNNPAIYDPWQHLVSRPLRDPVVVA